MTTIIIYYCYFYKKYMYIQLHHDNKKKKTNHQTLWHFFDYSYSYLLGKLIIDLLPPCFFKPKLLIDLLDE